jgi:uncharacterized membrane protein YphA (DoxX/SURF4 family)
MTGTCTDCRLPAPENRPPRSFALLKTACRYALAAVFLMAAVSKITDPHGFADRVLLHSPLPPAVGQTVVLLLPWVELTCGACLALGCAAREAAVILCLLLFPMLGYALVHAGEPDCGCFVFPWVPPATNGWWPTARNLLLLLCGLRAAW